jgi:Arc/MetJ-type ribon-helix-helix transcriptional regulator
MKLSVSLPDEDVEFLDAYAEGQGIASRSAVLHKAVRLLRASELGPAYEDAWVEWHSGGEAISWDATVGDGLA